MIGLSGKPSAAARVATFVAFLVVIATVMTAVMSFIHYHQLQLSAP
jgi:hypothetical protein